MPAIATQTPPKLEAELNRPVRLFNRSDETFSFRFGGEMFRIPGKSHNAPRGCMATVRACVANHIFGDPRCREEHPDNADKPYDPKMWEREVRAKRESLGDPRSLNIKERHFERLIESGLVGCVEYGTHRPGYYMSPRKVLASTTIAIPMSEQDYFLLEGDAPPTAISFAPISDEDLEAVLGAETTSVGAGHKGVAGSLAMSHEQALSESLSQGELEGTSPYPQAHESSLVTPQRR